MKTVLGNEQYLSEGALFEENLLFSSIWVELNGEWLNREATFKSRGEKNKDLQWEKKVNAKTSIFWRKYSHSPRDKGEAQARKKKEQNPLLFWVCEQLEI